MAKLISPHTLVIVGPPGSGKGTQAAHLASTLGWPHVDVGELLREAARGDSAAALVIRHTMQQGSMLSQEVVKPVVAEAIANKSAGLVLDGYARQVGQVQVLAEWAESGLIPPLWGIELSVPTDEILERIKQRRYCLDCRHKNYLVTNTDEAVKCLRCGGHLSKRADDVAETVSQRLKTYESETKPAIADLTKIAPVSVIDGRGSIEEVAGRIITTLKNAPAH